MKKITPGIPHKSVLLTEVVEALAIGPHKTYLDVTFGAGGHTRAILEKEPTCTVIAMDWDALSIETFGQPLQEEFGERISFIWSNFAHLYKLVKKHNLQNLDGILADFGTSQVQISSTPGISFSRDTLLDMRLSPAHQPVTAGDVLNKATEEKLAQIFFQLGQEAKSRQIARAIVHARTKIKLQTTGQLVDIIETIIPTRRRSIHPATKIFQALRIYVNHELENISAFLPAALSALAPGGRLVCISFHSLEDRLVKQFFKEQEVQGKLEIISSGAITPTDLEVALNPSARSAKMRVAQKL